ncbi:MAG: sigma-70 family RNA polymerase sigma factor [Bryobacterales bacterium]|nr:sigma-70 family RNA polymerase sigma factor [Bryobacterales bacterium]MDE0261515.1 sigma-70 family RNA polymerase sigma factor [Bryobacterales bacterium]MDE0620325.1 sigma-70 family RNA polymerase sigma factor [Bryobacterales bacterium]
MAKEFRILPAPSLAQASRACPLLDTQSGREAWAACCSRRFFPVARRIVGDDDLAQDILQESWTRVLEHVCAYRGGSPACAWVRSIVHNCAINFQRDRLKKADELSVNFKDPSLTPEAQAHHEQLRLLLREMLAELPAMYREVCDLRYGQDLSTDETASQLGISRSNVSTRLNRAIRMLKARLEARLGPDLERFL